MKQRATTKLRELLARPGATVAAGCYDALGAKLIDAAGFDVVSVSGSSVSVSCGFPDWNLTTMTEVLERVRQIVNVTDKPVIVDVDEGYGSVINLRRTVREFERAGVAGIRFEDQVTPKRYPFKRDKSTMDTLALVSQDEMCRKIQVALDAREDPDFTITGRTDARPLYGIDEAIKRANAYLAAGADMAFAAAFGAGASDAQKRADCEKLVRSVKGPLMFTVYKGGPIITVRELEALGYKLVLFPVAVAHTTIKAVRDVLSEIMRSGTDKNVYDRMIDSYFDIFELLGLADIQAAEAKFLGGQHE